LNPEEKVEQVGARKMARSLAGRVLNVKHQD
jgi:hypothetical protein